MRAIIGDRVEFVELVFTQTLGGQVRDTKTKTRHGQDDQSDEKQSLATRQDTATGKEVRSQTGGDNDFSSCRQIQSSAKRARVAEESSECQRGSIQRLHRFF